MTQRHIEQLMEAQDILTSVYRDIEDKRGHKRDAARLDTVRGKLYNLIQDTIIEGVDKCQK